MDYEDIEPKLKREEIRNLLSLGLYAHVEVIKQNLEDARFRAEQGID